MRIQKCDPDGARSDTEAVELLVETFEAHGVIFTISADGRLHTDLNALGPAPPYADAISAALLLLGTPIKNFLALRAVEPVTTH